jgi:predicted  nucleic acid-binding Zn-ribbon protein
MATVYGLNQKLQKEKNKAENIENAQKVVALEKENEALKKENEELKAQLKEASENGTNGKDSAGGSGTSKAKGTGK